MSSRRRDASSFAPFVRSHDQIEIDGGAGTLDPPQLDPHAEELRVFARARVEEVQSRAVFITELLGNPDDDAGVVTGGVRENLPEMGVVGRSQLVLDDHRTSATLTGQEIQRERSDRCLSLLDFEIHPQGTAKLVDVLLQPWCEVGRLVRPDVPKIDLL